MFEVTKKGDIYDTSAGPNMVVSKETFEKHYPFQAPIERAKALGLFKRNCTFTTAWGELHAFDETGTIWIASWIREDAHSEKEWHFLDQV